MTGHGRPFSTAGFGNWFRQKRDQAGLEGYSAHGLRKAAGVMLAESGASAHQIMSILGHATLAEAQRYTLSARQRVLAEEAMALVTDEQEQKQNVSNLSENVSKPDVSSLFY